MDQTEPTDTTPASTIGQGVTDMLMDVLPSSVAQLAGNIWWILLIVFVLSIAVGWFLGRPKEG